MSRIAKYPVAVPKGVEVNIAGGNISVKGPLGTIARAADPNVALEKKGDSVEFTDVLMIGEGRNLKVGTPKVAGGEVKAKVLAQGRSDKVSVIKFKRRTTYKRIGNHRQSFTLVEITGITGGPKAKDAAAAAE